MNNFTNIVTQKFLHTAEKHLMFSNLDKVIVGFSGGADSVCLLHLLNSVKSDYNFDLLAVHINHGIRGDEATRDEDFAKSFCENRQIPFKALSIDCIEEAKKSKESLEECGRRIRYEIFESFCSEKTKIATAHNANDNAETVIFNITRGTTVKGLCGIPFVRGNIIRPILDCSREEIEGYCKENQLDFVVDSTNLSDDYTRNKIRHNILTVMKDMNPSFLDAFSSLVSNASDVSDYLIAQANSLLADAKIDDNIYNSEILLKAHSALSSEAVFIAFKNFSGKSLDFNKEL